MPHQCTNCGRTFADGSKEMLSGCPDCGGNKFQFAPKGRLGRSDAADGTAASDAAEGAAPDTSDAADGTAADAADDTVADANAADTSDGRSDRSPGRSTTAPSPETAAPADDSNDETTENAAQAEARSEVVSSDDLPPRSERSPPEERVDDRDVPSGDPTDPREEPEHGRVVSEPEGGDRPSMEELREELDDQFESIKIVQPGRYELNLMELYDREEYIISLQEDGRYVIDVPDSWRETDDE